MPCHEGIDLTTRAGCWVILNLNPGCQRNGGFLCRVQGQSSKIYRGFHWEGWFSISRASASCYGHNDLYIATYRGDATLDSMTTPQKDLQYCNCSSLVRSEERLLREVHTSASHPV